MAKVHLRFISLIGVIVPRRLRADWRQEWEAELRYREAMLAEWEKLNWRKKLDLLRRSLGAFWDAMWLQPQRWEEDMFQDLRFGWRMLAHKKAFASIAILTLALGIGANTAIFSVVNALMLRPLPYSEPERLIWVEELSKTNPNNPVVGAHLLEWQEQCRTLQHIAGYRGGFRSLTGDSEPERLECAQVSASFFPALGVQPFIGRNFLDAEDRVAGERVVILSHGIWQRRFGADRNIVGKPILLDDLPYTIIGVLPASFRYAQAFELWAPLALDPQEERGNQMASMLNSVARLNPGVTLEQARVEMEAVRERYDTTKPPGMPVFANEVRLTPLQDRLLGSTRRGLLVLVGAVGLILLIACANVANLLLARSAARKKELAVRAALGAGTLRLVRQLLTESLLLAAGGGTAGLMLAYLLSRLLAFSNPATSIGDIARLSEISIDGRVLAFTLVLSILTAVLFGLLPALQLVRSDLQSDLKEGGRAGALQSSRMRNLLTISEVTLAVVLLVGAGLLIRSFVNLLDIDPGYRSDRLLTACISLPPRYQERARRAQFYEQTFDRLASLPGVESVGAISHLPLTNVSLGGWLRVEGGSEIRQDEPPVPIGAVNAEYFDVMGIPLLAGRTFTESDNSESPRVLVISEALSQRLFSGQDPIGRRIRVPGSGAPWTTVVGIVGDVHHAGLDQAVGPAAYLSYRQAPPLQLWLAVRATIDPLALAPSVRDAVQAVDPGLPVHQVMGMNQRLADSVATRRFNLMLLGGFALVALLLAAVGVYGVIGFLVTQRTHEVGIRMALGARTLDVLRLFVLQGMSLVCAGLVLGLIGALALTRVMTSLLFEVSATDPLTFIAVAVLLTLVAFAACYLPARRAASINPITALRHE